MEAEFIIVENALCDNSNNRMKQSVEVWEIKR